MPADERAGELIAPESELEMSDSESEVEYIEPDSTHLQMDKTAQQILCPPVVAQTRPMEGCDPVLPRRLRWGRDVLTEDGAVVVDTRQVSADSASPMADHAQSGVDVTDTVLEAAIRKIMRSELEPIRQEMSDISQSVIANDAKSLAQEAQSLATKATDSATEACTRVTSVTGDISSIKADLAKCMANQSDLYENQLRMEAYSRRNNLKLEGIKESPDEILDEKVRTLLSKKNVSPDVPLLACHRFGARGKGSGSRPTIIKFLKYSDRNDVWKNRRALKDENIWVKEDYPAKIEDRRKVLHPFLRAAYQGDPANPHAKVSAYMQLDKLILNNQTFTHDTIHKLPEYVKNPSQSTQSSRQNDDIMIFFTKESPLSNFHDSRFELDDRTFANAEQYLTFKKMLLFDNATTANKINVNI